MVIGKRLFVVEVDVCVGCECCMFACSGGISETGIAKSPIHVRSTDGVEKGFVVIVCRAYEDPPCIKACPTDTL